MNRFDLKNFTVKIVCEDTDKDARTETVINEDTLEIYLSATESKPEFVEIEWCFESDENLLVLGDSWERSYGDLQFISIRENKRYMPWYFIAANNTDRFCFGIKTGSNSFVSFRYTTEGITALIDCRNGGNGVHLQGRKLKLATFLFKKYKDKDVFDCLCDYCKSLCEKPILPDFRVYGGNDWYYAYGKNNYKEIVSDAQLQSEFSGKTDNSPFMVVDDGWQKNKTAGPWVANRKFKDMAALCRDINKSGARAGIWVRFLRNKSRSVSPDMRILRNKKRQYLDPTHPEVQKLIKNDIEKIKGWGFALIKHDFSTVDLFGDYGMNLDATITKIKGWHFYDKTKTNAEIVLDFYTLIKETCGDMLIIGCNTVSHLSAGLVHINRTGDDTSGTQWERTKKMGVNTLAFRLAQNNAFYVVDADCVGILKKKIPWDKNRQWLHLLSKSNTALFISCCKVTDEQFIDIAEAYCTCQQEHSIKPLDWLENKTPQKWLVDGTEITYNW